MSSVSDGQPPSGLPPAGIVRPPLLSRLLAPRLPFFYGWVVLGCLCLSGFARQGPAVATLSVFVVPMTAEFGWSRAAIAGAVSLGGVLAAFAAPLLGPMMDRRGARLILCLAVLGTGLSTMALSLTHSLLFFYLVFCFARMIWAAPYELGLSGALNNWFVAGRARANSISTLFQMSGLVAMPILAQYAMRDGDWRDGWVAIGTTVLAIGFLPAWLLLVRRPEDLGLLPDRAPAGGATGPREPAFTRAQAIRTSAFWLLAIYTLLVFPVQAGVSLHQAPHLIERGFSPLLAATVISVFSAMSAVASLTIGFLPRRWPIRASMVVAALLMSAGTFGLIGVETAVGAFVAAGVFGFGIGGIMTTLPVAWADYFGRESYGAIRGAALTFQVVGAAIGPLLSGALRDWSGSYSYSLAVLGTSALVAAFVVLAARRPVA
jgi:OFA family oxalate/formate antiporter-like MFS transporter